MKKMLLAFYFSILFLIPFHFSYAASDTSQFSHGRIYFNCQNENLKKKSPNSLDVCVLDKVIPSSDITYFQALKAIYPDLQLSGKATIRSAVRVEIQGMDESAKPGETISTSPGQSFDLNGNSRTFLYYSMAQRKNFSQLIILSDGGGDMPVLGLFQLTLQLKLLDLIHVDLDRWVSMGSFLFDVKENSPLFILAASHNNSSQAYVLSSLWIILHDKLHQVYDGPNLSGQRMELQDCRTHAEIKKIKTLASQHAGFADISLELSRSKICTNKKTGKDIKLQEKIYPATLIWDDIKNKYVGGSKSFERESPFQP